MKLNKDGVPIGEWAAPLNRYIASVARSKVDINYASWKDVPESLKELIVVDVMVIYEIIRIYEKLAY